MSEMEMEEYVEAMEELESAPEQEQAEKRERAIQTLEADIRSLSETLTAKRQALRYLLKE